MSIHIAEKCYIHSYRRVERSEASKLSGDMVGHTRRRYEALLGAVSVGFFFVLIGVLFINMPNLFDNVVKFFNHWQTFHLKTTNVDVPVPEHLGDNVAQGVYLAARDFSLIWGIFLGVMLGLRFMFDSPTRRKGQNVGDAVFWLGAAFLIQTLLIETMPGESIEQMRWSWLAFWGAVIALIGVSLIARAIFLVAARIARNV
jgi:hypothetical protein